MNILDLPSTFIVEQDAGTTGAEIIVPVRTVTSPNAREHKFARHRRVKAERAALRRAFLGRLVPPLPVVVTFVRMSEQTCDDDNLPTAAKGLRDELAALYGVGDSPRDPIRWAYEQERCKRGTFGVRVRIEAAR